MQKPIPFGKYQLLDRISVGGMAEVFKAKTYGVEGFERIVAIKRILPSIAEDEEFITMFIDEAKIAVQLTHENIAQIFDLGKVGEAFFIALEYIEGKDLRAIFDRMRKKGQAVPVPMAVYMIMKACEGLDYAHNKKDGSGNDLNLVHRDVSPQNILVSFDGQVKLIDFGIAKAAGKAGKTQAGILKGKFGYMSPEQVRGMPLDRRSDIFALGICLWEMLTGERLFVGESDFSTLEKVRNVDIVPPSSFNKRIPGDLEKIVLKALSKEVSDRYQSAMDLHDDLQSWMYTSGSFFSRKDLSSFQAEVFREDIEKIAMQNEAMEEALLRSSVPPPPLPVPPRAAGTPPIPRPGGATLQPPPPPRATGIPVAPPRPTTPGGPPRPTGTPAMPGPMPSPSPMVPSAPKRTVMGMPTPTLPPDLASGKVATPQSAVQMEWDDDEEPTNIYGKDTAAQMAAAANRPAPAPPAPSPTPAPVPRQVGSSAMPARAPMVQSTDRRSSSSVSGVLEDSASGVSSRSGGNRALVIGIAVGVIVAVALAVVLYRAFIHAPTGAIELSVSPGDRLNVVINGTQKVAQNVSPMFIDNLRAGDHSFIISRDGYVSQESIFSVKSGRTDSFNVKLEPEQTESGFQLETDPPGCAVEVAGRLIEGKTPLTVRDLSPGTHVVRITKDDYRDLRFEVKIEAGIIESLPRKKLELTQVEVTFNTEPQGNRVVLLDGDRRIDIGRTPATQKLATDQSYRVEYECGKERIVRNLDQSLFAGKGPQVSLDAEPCGAVAAQVAQAPRAQPRAAAPAATPRPQPAPAAAGAEGYLSVQTRPWSRVHINGQFIKNTPLVRHPLRPGTYNVMVENPDFGVKRQFSVTIKSGETRTLVEKLI